MNNILSMYTKKAAVISYEWFKTNYGCRLWSWKDLRFIHDGGLESSGFTKVENVMTMQLNMKLWRDILYHGVQSCRNRL